MKATRVQTPSSDYVNGNALPLFEVQPERQLEDVQVKTPRPGGKFAPQPPAAARGAQSVASVTSSLNTAPKSIESLLSPALARFLGDINLHDFVANSVEGGRIGKALEKIDGIAELEHVDGKGKPKFADALALYDNAFKPPEAEPIEDIRQRLADMHTLAHPRANKARAAELRTQFGESRFHVLALTSRGAVVGYFQFSTMPVGKEGMVVYNQYVTVADGQFMKARYGRDENMRQNGMLSLMHTVSLAMAQRDAMLMGRSKVVGTIYESEIRGQAGEEGRAATLEELRFTKTRHDIHNRVGGRPIMLVTATGAQQTAHHQPPLSRADASIMLLLMFRPVKFSPDDIGKRETPDRETMRATVEAFYDNFIREGFSGAKKMKSTMMKRFDGAASIELIAPHLVGDIVALAKTDPDLRKQAERDYGSLDAFALRLGEAFA
jgi:hypothetical protein